MLSLTCKLGLQSDDKIYKLPFKIRTSVLCLEFSVQLQNSACQRLFHRNISEQAPERKYFIREQKQGFKTSGKLEMEHFYQKEPILIELFIRITTNFKVFALSSQTIEI